jgi:16S rRNA (uracil1498-N3)-methyltransferase
VEASTAAYALHEEAADPLAAQCLPSSGDVLLIVGPEGGITPDELAALTTAGAAPVRLGATVLRSSSAGPAALAVLSAADRWR